jgi:hypothetical protein
MTTVRLKLSSAKGNPSASASTRSISTPRAAAIRRPATNSSGVRSDATTVVPRAAAGMAAFPEPAPTSRTRWPARTPTARNQLRPECGDQLGGHGRVVARRPQRPVLGRQPTVGGYVQNVGPGRFSSGFSATGVRRGNWAGQVVCDLM